MKKVNISTTLTVIALAAFVSSIMLLSFIHKSKVYEQTNNAVELTVRKKEFVVYAQTNGTLESSTISVGQHVKKGDVIGKLSNQTLDNQISALTAMEHNPSAAIQLTQLNAEKASQILYSPTDGVVASTASQGEAINNVQKVATIYSDDAVQLQGRFSYMNYNLFQQNMSNLIATSLRDSQEYNIEYGGSFQEVGGDQNKNSYVTLFFTFTSSNDAINALQGEEMSLKIVKDDGNKKPIDTIKDIYAKSIFAPRL